MEEKHYNIALKYSYADYPANPNGSDYAVAGVASADGRHVAMMPHLERAIKPWNWAYYPEQREDEVTSLFVPPVPALFASPPTVIIPTES